MTSTLKYRIGIWLVVLAVITGLWLWRRNTRDAGPSQEPQIIVKVDWEPQPLNLDDYEFVERSGRPFKFSELDGQVWAASFFFGQCPGPCRLMNNRLAQVRRQLGDQPITFVSISVDPQNDTPERLRDYAEQFGADKDKWLFLTGDADQVSRLAEDLVVGVGVRQEGQRDIAHSEKLIPIDRAGRMHFPMSVGSEADVNAAARKLRELLDAKETDAPTKQDQT